MGKLKQILIVAFFATSFASYAADLMDIYYQALESDPSFKTAYSQYLSQKESIPIAQAALKPQVTVGGQVTQNYLQVDTQISNVTDYYYGDEWHVNASQALFNYHAWAMVKQARASVKAALAQFNDAAQNLMLRTTDSYLAILYAIDSLNYAEAKKRANKRHLEEAQHRFDVGLDPITAVYEAKAAYDQSTAQVIASENNLINQNDNLSRLTNTIYDSLAPLRNSKIPLINPEPNSIDEWVNTGLKQNYMLYAAKYNLQAERDNVKATSTSNWPVFSVVGGTSTTHLQPGSGIDQGGTTDEFFGNVFIPARTVKSSIGVTVNYPVLQGGSVEAKTKQAQYKFQAASEQLEKVHRDVIANTRIAYNSIVDGISKIKADRQTVLSQQSSLESVQAQYSVGTRTMTDVVTAQERLFQAQVTLAKDQYDLISQLLKLKYLAGTLSANDLQEINAWLATTRVDSLPPRAMRRS